MTETDEAGRFLFRPVPAGRYLVRAVRDREVLVEVTVGPEADLDIALYLPSSRAK